MLVIQLVSGVHFTLDIVVVLNSSSLCSMEEQHKCVLIRFWSALLEFTMYRSLNYCDLAFNKCRMVLVAGTLMVLNYPQFMAIASRSIIN